MSEKENEPADEAFVRELIPETFVSPHVLAGRLGHVSWSKCRGKLTIKIRANCYSVGTLTRRQLRYIVNENKGR